MRPARGQSTVELLAVLPLLVALLLGAAQCVVLGWALVEAHDAARTAARAATLGGDGPAAARAALPVSLRRAARVSASDAGLVVEVRAPRLVPAAPLALRVVAPW